jgi:hypothetical protein
LPEELLHRPFVWAYFVVCAWASAAASHLLIDYSQQHQLQALPKKKLLWPLPGLLFIPLLFSHKIQTMPLWEDFANFPRVPTCLVKSAGYIRDHSLAWDIVQDSRQGI